MEKLSPVETPGREAHHLIAATQGAENCISFILQQTSESVDQTSHVRLGYCAAPGSRCAAQPETTVLSSHSLGCYMQRHLSHSVLSNVVTLKSITPAPARGEDSSSVCFWHEKQMISFSPLLKNSWSVAIARLYHCTMHTCICSCTHTLLRKHMRAKRPSDLKTPL